MMMLPLLLLVGLGVWYATRHGITFSWLWVVAGGLLLLGCSGFGLRGGMMAMHGGMRGMRGGMMPAMRGGGFVGGGAHPWINLGVHAALILAAIVVAYFAWRRSRSAGPTEPEELRILRLRLAKGEITADEYDLLRSKLQG